MLTKKCKEQILYPLNSKFFNEYEIHQITRKFKFYFISSRSEHLKCKIVASHFQFRSNSEVKLFISF